MKCTFQLIAPHRLITVTAIAAAAISCGRSPSQVPSPQRGGHAESEVKASSVCDIWGQDYPGATSFAICNSMGTTPAVLTCTRKTIASNWKGRYRKCLNPTPRCTPIQGGWAGCSS